MERRRQIASTGFSVISLGLVAYGLVMHKPGLVIGGILAAILLVVVYFFVSVSKI